MDLSGNDKNKITGKKYQPVMSVTGLNDQGLYYYYYYSDVMKLLIDLVHVNSCPACFACSLSV